MHTTTMPTMLHAPANRSSAGRMRMPNALRRNVRHPKADITMKVCHGAVANVSCQKDTRLRARVSSRAGRVALHGFAKQDGVAHSPQNKVCAKRTARRQERHPPRARHPAREERQRVLELVRGEDVWGAVSASLVARRRHSQAQSYCPPAIGRTWQISALRGQQRAKHTTYIEIPVASVPIALTNRPYTIATDPPVPRMTGRLGCERAAGRWSATYDAALEGGRRVSAVSVCATRRRQLTSLWVSAHSLRERMHAPGVA